MNRAEPPMEEINLENLSTSAPYKMMGCFISKVASSSLVSTFLLVNGFGATFDSPHGLAPYLRPKVNRLLIFISLKFLIFFRLIQSAHLMRRFMFFFAVLARPSQSMLFLKNHGKHASFNSLRNFMLNNLISISIRLS